MKKACVFVDGENFRYSINELFRNEFTQSDYLPKTADWEGFFNWVLECFEKDCELVRVYWYVVENMDFWPYNLTKLSKDPELLKRTLCKHDPYKVQLCDLEGDDLTSTMEGILNQLRDKERKVRKRFDGWITLQNGISTKHKAIEFRRSGAIRYNLYTDSLGEEKAVDVKLATDLITLNGIYDVAIIVSGDQDYVPAVQCIKDLGKRVINITFTMRNGKPLPKGAWRLNLATDWNVEIPYDEFKKKMNLMAVAKPVISPRHMHMKE